jgi:ABC-2 type transport system permease protein
MIATIRAEFRKLFTVRSTYIIILIALALEVFFAFYATAYKASPSDALKPGELASEVTSAISVLTTLFALVGVLLMAHEYRYNTILYTLSSSKSRSRVFFAKIITVSIFAIILSVSFGFLSAGLAKLGFQAHGHTLVAQTFPVWNLLWRVAFAGWAFSMLALILTTIIRIQVGAIAALFLIPGTIEQLIGLLIKKNQVYLPFSAINAVLDHGDISHERAALVALAYVVGGWVIAWLLFLKRDAN